MSRDGGVKEADAGPADTGAPQGDGGIAEADAGSGDAAAPKGDGGIEPIELNPTALDFGDVAVGSIRKRSVNITNSSGGDLSVTLAAESNLRDCTDPDDPSDFCVIPPGRQPSAFRTFLLAAGWTTRIDVEFRPRALGVTERAALSLRTCPDDACRVEVPMHGVGASVRLECAPDPVDLGDVMIGRCATEHAVCTNRTAGDLGVVGWFVTGDGPFFWTDGDPSTLAPGATLEIQVQYCAIASGRDAATLEILLVDDDRVMAPLTARGI